MRDSHCIRAVVLEFLVEIKQELISVMIKTETILDGLTWSGGIPSTIAGSLVDIL